MISQGPFQILFFLFFSPKTAELETVKMLYPGAPWWSSGYDSMHPKQGTQVWSLVTEMDPSCWNQVQPNKQTHMFKKRCCAAPQPWPSFPSAASSPSSAPGELDTSDDTPTPITPKQRSLSHGPLKVPCREKATPGSDVRCLAIQAVVGRWSVCPYIEPTSRVISAHSLCTENALSDLQDELLFSLSWQVCFLFH